MVFHGRAAEAAHFFLGLGESTISHKDIPPQIELNHNGTDILISGVNEGLRIAGYPVGIRNQDQQYSLEANPSSQDGKAPLGHPGLGIPTLDGGTTVLEGGLLDIFHSLQQSERDGSRGGISQRNIQLLQDRLCGSQAVVRVRREGDRNYLGMPKPTGLTEAWVIDVDVQLEQSEDRVGENGHRRSASTAAQTVWKIPGEKNGSNRSDVVDLLEGAADASNSSVKSHAEIVFDPDNRASIRAEQADYARKAGDIPVITAGQQAEYFPSVLTLPYQGTLFYQATTHPAAVPEEDGVGLASVHQLGFQSEVVFRGSGSGGLSGLPLDGLDEASEPLRYANLGISRISAAAETGAESISKNRLQKVLADSVKEVAANKVLARGARPEDVIKELGDRVIRYRNDRIDQPITYQDLLGDLVPKLTRAEKHRPWDIAAILVFMDYGGQLTPEQQQTVLEKAQATYERWQRFQELRAKEKPPQRVSAKTLRNRLSIVVEEVGSASLPDRVTIEEAVAAFPDLVGASDLTDGYLNRTDIIALRCLTFYGDRLYPIQQRWVKENAASKYKRWLAQQAA